MKLKQLSTIEQFITELNRKQSAKRDDIFALQRRFCKKYNRTNFFRKDELMESYRRMLSQGKIKPNKKLEQAFVLKQVRSLSGIVVVSLLTKPFPCPGKCLYCPTEMGAPKSYLKNEPAVARAIMCKYDPYLQVKARLQALKNIGHPIDKINIRIIGGTWSYYPKNYQTWFMKKIYKAVNEFETRIRNNELGTRVLNQLQQANEKAKCRIVEISVETRQDYIDNNEIKRLRNFGVTKVELGVQALDDDVLKINRRGHDIKTTIKATKLLKDAGFKVAYQMMANLYGSNLKKDKKMFEELFNNADFRPDYLKIYPQALVKNSGTYILYKNKKYKPYSKKQLKNLIKYIKSIVPYYLRIERIIRDIPTNKIIEGGAKISNLRQIIKEEMKEENLKCKCIRCREIKDNDFKRIIPLLIIYKYKSSEGIEYFLSYESKKRDKLFSILRLRITKDLNILELKDAAIIREIHTYGRELPVSKNEKLASQHHGLGKNLIKEAEQIARNNGLEKIAVISGIGARPYFRKLGYKLENTYMIKSIS